MAGAVPTPSPTKRRGVLLTIWLWGLVVVSALLIVSGVLLKLSGRLTDYPPAMLLLGSLSSGLVIVASFAALRFRRLGVYGLYFLFGTNFIRFLIVEHENFAVRAAIQVVAAVAFGLLCARVWKEFA